MTSHVVAFERPQVRAGARSVSLDEVDQRVAGATEALLRERKGDGHWCFELEADATIPSEYVLFRHFRGEPEHLGRSKPSPAEERRERQAGESEYEEDEAAPLRHGSGPSEGEAAADDTDPKKERRLCCTASLRPRSERSRIATPSANAAICAGQIAAL